MSYAIVTEKGKVQVLNNSLPDIKVMINKGEFGQNPTVIDTYKNKEIKIR